MGLTMQTANMYVFGPLMDTILTTLKYMQKSMMDMGMEIINLCMDMHLCVGTRLEKFHNIVVYSGGMHIIFFPLHWNLCLKILCDCNLW